jgi:uncharacterized transporter YbjL
MYKYLKYKSKYLNVLQQYGGDDEIEIEKLYNSKEKKIINIYDEKLRELEILKQNDIIANKIKIEQLYEKTFDELKISKEKDILAIRAEKAKAKAKSLLAESVKAEEVKSVEAERVEAERVEAKAKKEADRMALIESRLPRDRRTTEDGRRRADKISRSPGLGFEIPDYRF